MDENHQGETGSKLMTTEDELWLPPLSPKDQKKVEHLQKKPFAERTVAGKTSWDWIQLALQIVGALAVLLTLISLIVNVQQFKEQQRSENDRTIQQQRSEQSRAIDQQQQTTLETYLDRMSDLLFTQHLDTSQQGAEVRQVARARTLTALQNLNPARKGILLRFLYESNLIGYFDVTTDSLRSSIVALSGADLSGADLSGAPLRGADLRGANLYKANLRFANLSYADLFLAKLWGADLRSAVLNQANLRAAFLIDADLRGADLRAAKLDGTPLRGARYNTKEILVRDSQGKIVETIPPTQWPQGFAPKARGAIETNTYP